MKKFFLALCIVLSLSFAHTVKGAEQSASTVVSNFYAWYFAHEHTMAAELHKEAVQAYLSPLLIQNLQQHSRQGRAQDVDYFIQVGERGPDWNTTVKILQEQQLPNGITIVPVTFGAAQEAVVVVFLQRDKDTFKIVQIKDCYPYM